MQYIFLNHLNMVFRYHFYYNICACVKSIICKQQYFKMGRGLILNYINKLIDLVKEEKRC